MSTQQEDEKVWDEFLTRWPIENLQTMTLENYSTAGNKDCFTYWVEWGTNQLGGISGGSSFMFGIYNRADSSDMENGQGRVFGEKYAWYEKYGDTQDEAFQNIRGIIIKVANAARQADWKAIDALDLGLAFKWKLAFLYQDKGHAKIIPDVVKDFVTPQLSRFLHFH